MGHEIEKAAIERGHTILATPDNSHDWDSITLSPELCDIVVDFSSPASAPLVVNKCLEAGIPVVSGTTGWQPELEKSKEFCKSVNGTFFYAPNFSIGVNIFFEINRKLACLLSELDYKVRLSEIHHIHKLDAPSGTAIALANQIISENKKYKSWDTGITEDNSTIPVNCERTGEVPGTHVVEWSSGADTLELKHTAHNRHGFALGAVLAAEWVRGKTGFYGMADMINPDK